jgi:zinc D-Ala-D-Ala carboxypeptidase
MFKLSDGTTISHFQKRDFRCRCKCGNGVEEMDEVFLASLDYAREMAKVPFIISSAFRCEAHNINVGGSPNSAHLRGTAVDISCTFSDNRYAILEGLREAGITRIGIRKDFIHADADAKKNQRRIWIY